MKINIASKEVIHFYWHRWYWHEWFGTGNEKYGFYNSRE